MFTVSSGSLQLSFNGIDLCFKYTRPIPVNNSDPPHHSGSMCRRENISLIVKEGVRDEACQGRVFFLFTPTVKIWLFVAMCGFVCSCDGSAGQRTRWHSSRDQKSWSVPVMLSLPSNITEQWLCSILTVVDNLSCVWAVVMYSVCHPEVSLVSVKHLMYTVVSSAQVIISFSGTQHFFGV